MGYNVHDALNKVVAYNTRKLKKCKRWMFLLWFEIMIILQVERLNLQGICTLKKNHINSTMIFKMWCIEANVRF
jgi:hypothetical protein